jgi:hypothetical protein
MGVLHPPRPIDTHRVSSRPAMMRGPARVRKGLQDLASVCWTALRYPERQLLIPADPAPWPPHSRPTRASHSVNSPAPGSRTEPPFGAARGFPAITDCGIPIGLICGGSQVKDVLSRIGQFTPGGVMRAGGGSRRRRWLLPGEEYAFQFLAGAEDRGGGPWQPFRRCLRVGEVNDRRRAIGQRQQEVVRGRRRGDDPPAHRRQFMSGSSSRLSSAPSRSRRSRSARANPGRSCHGLGKTRSSSHDSIRRLLQRPWPHQNAGGPGTCPGV